MAYKGVLGNAPFTEEWGSGGSGGSADPSLVVYRGVCPDSGSDRAVSVDEGFELSEGAMVAVLFENKLDGNVMNLSVNGTESHPVVLASSASTLPYSLVKDGMLFVLRYTSGKWVATAPLAAGGSTRGTVVLSTNIVGDMNDTSKAVTPKAVVEYVSGKIGSVYRYRGQVDTYDDLLALETDPQVTLEFGDVYNVKETDINYAWAEPHGPSDDLEWDPMGPSMSGYLRTEDVLTGEGKIKNNLVVGASIANNVITTGKLTNNSVTTAKIADKAVTGDKISSNTVTGAANDQDTSVASGNLAYGTVGTVNLRDGSVTEAKLDSNLKDTIGMLVGSVVLYPVDENGDDIEGSDSKWTLSSSVINPISEESLESIRSIGQALWQITERDVTLDDEGYLYIGGFKISKGTVSDDGTTLYSSLSDTGNGRIISSAIGVEPGGVLATRGGATADLYAYRLGPREDNPNSDKLLQPAGMQPVTPDDVVLTVNGIHPDDNGNVEIETGSDITVDQAFDGESENPQSGVAILAAMTEAFNYSAMAISTFTAKDSGNTGSAFEIGRSIGSIRFDWSLNKKPKTLSVSGKYLESTALSVSSTSGNSTLTLSSALNPASFGSEGTTQVSYKYTLSATENEVVAHSPAKTATKDAYIYFRNRVIMGVSSDSDASADLLSRLYSGTAYSNKPLATSRAVTLTANAGTGQYIWYCYPRRFDYSGGSYSPKAVFKVGGFEGGFEYPAEAYGSTASKWIFSLTNASGFTEDYYMYRSTEHSLGSTQIVVS